MNNHFFPCWALFLVCSCSPALAYSIGVENFSFENPLLADGARTSSGPGAVPGWVASGASAVILNPLATAFPLEAPDGQNILSVAAGAGTVIQTLPAVMEKHTSYNLQFDVGVDRNVPCQGIGYRADLLAGGQIIASTSDTSGLVPGGWITVTTSVAPSYDDSILLGSALGIRIVNTGSHPMSFDNIRLESRPDLMAQAPAPASLLLLGSAMVTILARRRSSAGGPRKRQ